MTEEMLQQERDHEWVLRDPRRLKQYAGQIVAVYRETVWGVGLDHPTVMANATATIQQAAGRPSVPSVDDVTFVVVPDWFTEEFPTPAR
jgi:hypothetical protein